MDVRALNGQADICVLGGGIAGLVFARLLQAQQPARSVAVLDDDSGGQAGKTLVIDCAAAECLRQLEALPSCSAVINKVRVSVAGIAAKTIGGGAALGYGIAPLQVQNALRQSLSVYNARISGIDAAADKVILTTADGAIVQARYLIVACPFMLPPPFRTRRLSYHQSIFSLRAQTELPPATAYQRFFSRRVLVLVPRAEDNDTGVIICTPTSIAGDINALPDEDLSDYLSGQFGLSVRVRGNRFAYPPRLTRTSPLAQGRIILLGSGATTLHPIGAQAISLAIADARQLAAAFAQYDDALPPAAVARYQRRRLFAHRQKALLTSTLALGAFGAFGLF